MKFKVKDEIGKVRIGELEVNGRKIRTPCFWLGLELLSEPNPFEYFYFPTAMVNAYRIILKGLTSKNVRELVKAELVMMDSGGFQLMKKKENIKVENILDVYNKMKPDIGVVLDYPINPMEPEMREERWKKTIENTKYMLNSSEVCIMPVVHGFTIEEIKKACNDIREIVEPKIIGIGSLVPMVKAVKLEKFREANRMKAINFLLKAISTIRNEFPDSFLHVFGIGSSTTMHLMFANGVDSVDSMSWRLKASYGAIQLRGIGDRFISPKGRRKKLDEYSLLQECKCPICKGKSVEERIRNLDNSRADTFINRAIHNAFVCAAEYNDFFNNYEKGELREFLRMRLKKWVVGLN